MKTVKVFETFASLQGESTYAGVPCFFIRLSGCNLRCSYCDTSGAWDHGSERGVEDLVNDAAESGYPLIEVTGGEPLIQKHTKDLLEGLGGIETARVLVETNGTQDISVIPDGISAIMDIKSPSSGQSEWVDWKNMERLRMYDEVKFVIADRNDYEWARDVMQKHDLSKRCNAVLFGVVHDVLDASDLADWICNDRLEARLQLQMHKILGHQ